MENLNAIYPPFKEINTIKKYMNKLKEYEHLMSKSIEMTNNIFNETINCLDVVIV